MADSTSTTPPSQHHQDDATPGIEHPSEGPEDKGVEDTTADIKGTPVAFGNALTKCDIDPAMSQLPHRSLAVITSGGDAQGMNAAVRAIVRVAIFHGMKVYAVHEGYQGLVAGGDYIKQYRWSSVSNIIQKGGTTIGSTRCKEFKEREGRLKAAENLVKLGINNLAVIGGEGSLTGANVFKEEWKDLVKELVENGRVTEEEAEICSYLNVVGLVGTIDNDMCGTDMTIGTDSALHRIIEAIDCITSTAASHQRSFVLEVMGRDCGYLAQMAAIAGGADWVLIPEKPPEPNWEAEMCMKIDLCRKEGRRLSLVVITECAVDKWGNKITSKYVKEVLEHSLGHETRITVLGHVQRGGKPSAYDRLIGCQMGAAAALVLLEAEMEIPSKMIGIQGNTIVHLPLMSCVERTTAIDKARKALEFQRAFRLRGGGFIRNYEISQKLSACDPEKHEKDSRPVTTAKRFAVMNVGAPAAGTNSAVRAFVMLMIHSGHKVLGILDGFTGLLEGKICELGWMEVNKWGMDGGSHLGANRRQPTEKELPKIATRLTDKEIQGLLIIGGFDSFESLIMLEKHRERHIAFKIPMLCIAATIHNNVPGSEYSLGSDTALNTIVKACDVLRQAAHSSEKQVFIVETMGKSCDYPRPVTGEYCGYLATMAGIASGADAAYIFEDPFTREDLDKDLTHLREKFQHEDQGCGLLIRTPMCHGDFTLKSMKKKLIEEGEFTTNTNKLGHLQIGDQPTPYDRIVGVKYAQHAVDFFIDQVKENQVEGGAIRATTAESACVLGVVGTRVQTTPVRSHIQDTDFDHRIPKKQRWMELRRLFHVLAWQNEDLQEQ